MVEPHACQEANDIIVVSDDVVASLLMSYLFRPYEQMSFVANVPVCQPRLAPLRNPVFQSSYSSASRVYIIFSFFFFVYCLFWEIMPIANCFLSSLQVVSQLSGCLIVFILAYLILYLCYSVQRFIYASGSSDLPVADCNHVEADYGLAKLCTSSIIHERYG